MSTNLTYRPATLIGLIAGVGLGAAIGLAQSASSPQVQQQQQQQQPPPVFRGRTVVVPLDVRVLDRDGRPVRDLTAADFTVVEDNVPQKIEYFAPQSLAPAPPDPEDIIRPWAAREVSAIAPQTRRLFLIYFGRGRLQEPSKGVDATLRFVRERLNPQDQVAIMAWNRATDFTTDHRRAAAVIERFRAAHEEIEHEIRLYYTGLFGLYAGRDVPPRIQKLIDTVFDADPADTARHVLPAGTLTADAERDMNRSLSEALMRAEPDSYVYFGFSDTLMARGIIDRTLDMSFNQYLALNRQTLQDVGNLYAGIDFLRFIDGEKHLIYVTEQGHALPRAEYDRELAARASDARVAIDTIQTGGVDAMQSADGSVSIANPFPLVALREISQISGGQSSISRSAEWAFDRILASTEFGYLLAYSPANPAADGRIRSLRVTVNRRNVTVTHRRAYAVRRDADKFDPRESLARTRLVAAASVGSEVKDLNLATRLIDVNEGGRRFVNVEVVVGADRLRFARRGDEYIAALNFAVFCGDYYQKEIGQLWERKDIIVPAGRIDEIRTTGLTVSLRVPVTQPPIHVKVVAYDYGSDRVGSVMRRMR
jgi:VWFA-related protein